MVLETRYLPDPEDEDVLTGAALDDSEAGGEELDSAELEIGDRALDEENGGVDSAKLEDEGSSLNDDDALETAELADEGAALEDCDGEADVLDWKALDDV